MDRAGAAPAPDGQGRDRLSEQLSEAQRARMRAAYRAAGPGAVAGFRQVLEAMMDPDRRSGTMVA